MLRLLQPCEHIETGVRGVVAGRSGDRITMRVDGTGELRSYRAFLLKPMLAGASKASRHFTQRVSKWKASTKQLERQTKP